MARKDLALAQNGDLALNVSARAAGQLRHAGLINDGQWGAIAQGGHARFSFSANDLLVSSATGFQQSARNDSSTKFEAGKQAGPDTIEHMLGGGAEGHAQMARWLAGGFEMDRAGAWRLKPQVADTLERDLTAMIAQTGWRRSLGRSAEDQSALGTDVSAGVSAGATARGGGARGPVGSASVRAGLLSSERGISSETASASIDIVNYDVRAVIAASERQSAHSPSPEHAFTSTLAREMLGDRGVRNRYLEQADSARGTADLTAPLTSIDQASLLSKGRFTDDLANGPFDGDPTWKERRDQ
jgi:conjugal transfer mating pair stabilization protein TraG